MPRMPAQIAACPHCRSLQARQQPHILDDVATLLASCGGAPCPPRLPSPRLNSRSSTRLNSAALGDASRVMTAELVGGLTVENGFHPLVSSADERAARERAMAVAGDKM